VGNILSLLSACEFCISDIQFWQKDIQQGDSICVWLDD